MLSYDDITQRLVQWGEMQPDLRAVIVIGSRARTHVPADRWSDLDLLLVTNATQRYLDASDWLDELGPYWLTFLESTPTGGLKERRVLFEGALDVDLIPVPVERFRQMLQEGFPPEVAGPLALGARFVLDKDGLATQLRTPDAPPATEFPPREEQFLNLVNDFWYHAVWTTKKLLRGELWTALGGHDYMRNSALLPMLAWHAKVRHGQDYETWYAGRFVESWADTRAVQTLSKVFAHYDQHDIQRALLETMRLFAWLAATTAQHLGFSYPSEAERNVVNWVRREFATRQEES